MESGLYVFPAAIQLTEHMFCRFSLSRSIHASYRTLQSETDSQDSSTGPLTRTTYFSSEAETLSCLLHEAKTFLWDLVSRQ